MEERSSGGFFRVPTPERVACSVISRGNTHARKRLDELIGEAGQSLAPMDGATPVESENAFSAGWATARALGFLEACVLYETEDADLLVARFEAVVRAMDGLMIRAD